MRRPNVRKLRRDAIRILRRARHHRWLAILIAAAVAIGAWLGVAELLHYSALIAVEELFSAAMERE